MPDASGICPLLAQMLCVNSGVTPSMPALLALALGTRTSLADTNGSAFGQQVSYVYSPPTKPFLGIGHVFAYQNVDLRLEKAFTLASAQRISLVADLFNAFNNRKQIGFDTTVLPDFAGPVDALGLPLNFIRDNTFGEARGTGDFPKSLGDPGGRSFRMSFGVRF